MCRCWRLGFCSFANLCKVICALLTLILICQEVFTFVVEKPTTTSREQKYINIKDIPEVVICLEPGIDTTVLEKYGLHKRIYYKGKVIVHYKSKFIGWNRNETMSANEILEEALIVKDEHVKSSKFIFYAKYRSRGNQGVKPEISLRMLSWPFGRCLSIKPPALQEHMSSAANRLNLAFNETVFTRYEDMQVRLYLMDKTSSLKIYPDQNDMAGDPLKVQFDNYINRYKTRISRSQYVQGDPHIDCSKYTPDTSYNDCIQNELFGSFEKILGCHPPLFAKEPEKMCNGKFNLSADNLTEIVEVFNDLNSQDTSFKCKKPCTTNLYTSRLASKSPSSMTGIQLVFDQTIKVTRSTFSINEQTFLTRLGGSVSSGRTLLWLLVTLLGAPQVN